MRGRTAQLFCRDNFISYGFHNIRTRHEHVRAVLDHKDKIRHRRRIHRTTCTWAHDHRDLWNNARGLNVPLKDFAISRKAVNALLNTCATRIVQTDHRCAIFDGHVHNFANLLRMCRRYRTAQNSKVLREHINHATIDGAPSRHDTIASRALIFHTKIGAAVCNKHVKLFKAAFIQQKFDTLTRS